MFSKDAVNNQADFVTITPEMANEWLKRNNKNRAISSNLVDMFAEQMVRGDWQTNGESIILDEQGNLLDGQHRLRAIAKCGTAIKVLVARGIKADVFDTIDTGKSRNAADVLTISGYGAETASNCASAARFIIPFEWNGTYTFSSKLRYMLTPHAVSEWVLDHPELRYDFEKIKSWAGQNSPVAKSICLYLNYFMQQKSDKTDQFFEGFLTGVDLSRNDPRLHLRTKLYAMKTYRGRDGWPRTSQGGAVIRAWDWYIRGKEVLSNPHNMMQSFHRAYKLIQPDTFLIDTLDMGD